MACQHVFAAPFTAAKEGCYICRRADDVVVFDAVIEGEGVLAICTGCINDAAREAKAGRARMARANKAASEGS